MIELEHVESLSREAVRQTLKKRDQAAPEADVVYPAQVLGRIRPKSWDFVAEESGYVVP